MESKNIRVTFAELADVKAVMVLVSADLDTKWRAYTTLRSLGMRANSAAMAEARRDVSATAELLLVVTAEFRRLHTDCPCPTTDAEIAEGMESVEQLLSEVREHEAEAGPVDTDPGHAAEDLVKFLGATGIQVPEGYDRSEIPGLSYGDGTGMYL
jgi:hypothetical protein